MPRYTCDDMRAVTADSATDAAKVFAARLARAKYGRNGYCRVLRLDSWSQNGERHNFEAFIGRDAGGGTTSGSNVHLQVVQADEARRAA